MAGGRFEIYQGIFKSGDGTVDLNSESGSGFVFGHASAAANIIRGKGYAKSFAGGYAGGASGADILASGVGSFAVGYVKGSTNLSSTAPGSFSHGYSNGKMASTGFGSFAQGFCGASSELYNYEKGCFAQGYASVTGTIMSGYTYYTGCFSQGYAKNTGRVFAMYNGCFAQGFSDGTSDILANKNGCFAQGYTKTRGYVKAFDHGCFAQGYAKGDGDYKAWVQAYGLGAFAQGVCIVKEDCKSDLADYYDNSARLSASGNGSFIHGVSYCYKRALGFGSVLFSTDYYTSVYKVLNAIDNSIMMGGSDPIRIIGSGYPSGAFEFAPVNGDIWVDGNGYDDGTFVYIKSNGNICKVVGDGSYRL